MEIEMAQQMLVKLYTIKYLQRFLNFMFAGQLEDRWFLHLLRGVAKATKKENVKSVCC
jgi:CRISPR/Cas system-associated endoribonuclease Cas2